MLRQNMIFQAQILLLDAEFLLSLPLVLFFFSQIFSDFSLNCGGRNVGNNDEQSGEMDIGRSHGCTATSYLQLSDIAEVQHLNGFSRSTK